MAQTAQNAGVALRTVAGRAVEAIAQAACRRGRRRDCDRRSRSHRRAGLRRAAPPRRWSPSLDKPIVVVPPNAVVEPPHRAACSCRWTEPRACTAALQEIMELASAAELEIVVAHVYEQRSLPAFSDHLPHEVRAWREEFIARHCPAAVDARLELRVGEPREHLLDILRRKRLRARRARLESEPDGRSCRGGTPDAGRVTRAGAAHAHKP